MRTAKTDQTGRMLSSSLGAYSFCWFCHVTAQMIKRFVKLLLKGKTSDRYLLQRHFTNRDMNNTVNVAPMQPESLSNSTADDTRKLTKTDS